MMDVIGKKIELIVYFWIDYVIMKEFGVIYNDGFVNEYGWIV